MDILSNLFTDFTTQLIHIVVILLVAFLVYHLGKRVLDRIVRRAIRGSHRGWQQRDIDKRTKTLSHLFRSIWRIVAIAVVGMLVFRELFPTIDLTPVFASAGIIGLAVGFGSQALIKDFISGVFIISENQYRIGDIIEVNGATGTVEQLGTRSTIIRDADGNVHYFPNGTLQHVVNKTMGFSVARLAISVDSSSDLEKVIEIINTTGKQLADEPKWQRKIKTPPAFVAIEEFTAQSIKLDISGKTQPSDQWSVASEMRRRLLDEFEKNDIKL